MFQPHATPFSPFPSYGGLPDFHSFPHSQTTRSSAVVSAGPAIFQDPIFSSVNTNGNASTSASVSAYNDLDPHFKMSVSNVNDLEHQEELARSFQPDLQGPLVGEKRSVHAIAEEYAKGDPIYVRKTAALPSKYSHYRPILGDGNCGWRALGFAYFETLLRSNDKSQLEGEVARMTSLNNLLQNVGGHSPWVFEDFVEPTTDLLRDLAELVEDSPQSAANLLLERFNDVGISNSIVYHLRLLADSWLKNCAAQYEPFLSPEQGGSVDVYSRQWLLPTNQEIEHLGMQLLVDVLLKQIGFGAEVIYLDRTDSLEVNTHLMQAEDANGVPTNPLGPIIHLLYRPGHYDILYKDMDLSVPSQQAIDVTIQNLDLRVQRATSFSQQHNIQSTAMTDFTNGFDYTNLLSIPGFQCAPSNHGFLAQFQRSIEDSYSPVSESISPISPCTSATPPTSTNLSLSTEFPSQHVPTLVSSQTSIPQSPEASFPAQKMQLPIHGVPQSHVSPHSSRPSLPSHQSLSSQQSDLQSLASAASPFRPSRFTWDAQVADQEGPLIFQTSTFKNSHFNTAHYNNPNFQPEEWSPECEEMGGGPTISVGGRKRSC